MKIGILVIIFIILVVLYKNTNSNESLINVCNNTNKRCYSVVNKYENTAEASELLATINNFCIDFMRFLRKKYIFQNNQSIEATNIVKYMISNYNPDGIMENAPISDVNTSYVDEKGKIFALCLREKKSGLNNFHSLNELKFVVLHELAHMGNTEFGHDERFWTIFKFLLTQAEEANLYTNVNYQHNPMTYCSLEINYSPYFDENLKII